MAGIEEIKETRTKKLKELKNAKENPYPIEVSRTHTLTEVDSKYGTLSKGKKKLSLTGRIMSIRGQGAIVFVNLFDGTAVFQCALKKDEISEDKFELFHNTVDVGDFISATGSLFLTKTKQKTLLIKDWQMISKALRQLPDKWRGLQDVEERFRRRYLDTLMSEEVRGKFQIRSKIVVEIRKYLDNEDFQEVETPILQDLAGGASAKPFKTHHNALDIDLHLRIAPELFLKKLIIGGFPKVYEIARCFRNEGIDVTHNPEFTNMEFYDAYKSASDGIIFMEKFLKTLVKNVLKSMVFEYDGQKIDFSKKFKIVTFYDLLKQNVLISNPAEISHGELKLKASQLGVDVAGSDSKEKIMDNIYKKVIRPKLIQPTFVVDYPVSYIPLAKRKEDNPDLVDAFQFVCGGLEIVKAYSELNDPIDQAERFKLEEKLKEGGDEEAQSSDRDFIEALEYGMPPTFGVGFGVDRFAMLLTDSQNIREVILFPILRPKI